MLGSEIYTDFTKETIWIRERIREETLTFPDFLKPLADHYLRKRLIILSDNAQPIRIDPELGRPVPYAAFWFADAFGLANKEVAKRLALGLVYSALAATVRDDLIDRESPSTYHNVSLANLYLQRYLEIFHDLFQPDSEFWYYLADCNRELMRYESWNLLSNQAEPSFDPFSKPFLTESSRYFSAVVMPTLAAIAVATNNDGQIPAVNRFLKHFSMGWRIFDDLNDWRMDIRMDNLNHSSVLLHILKDVGEKSKLDEGAVLSIFLSIDFIERTYGAMLGFFREARKDVSTFNSSYLTRFMDEQISFHTRRRDNLLRTSSDFYKELSRILNK